MYVSIPVKINIEVFPEKDEFISCVSVSGYTINHFILFSLKRPCEGQKANGKMAFHFVSRKFN